jgi:hypothetical protein
VSAIFMVVNILISRAVLSLSLLCAEEITEAGGLFRGLGPGINPRLP